MSGKTDGFLRKREERDRRERQEKIVFEFGETLSNPPDGTFHDTKMLPYPKQEILGALLNEIANEQELTRIGIYEICASSLCIYQDNVGDSFKMPHIDKKKVTDMNKREINEVINSFDHNKLSRLSRLMAEDTEFINRCIVFARSCNPLFHPFYKKIWRRVKRHEAHGLHSGNFTDVSYRLLKV